MSKRVFAIHDLVEEIYDFGDVGRDKHRQKLELVLHELGLWFYDATQELENSHSSSDYPQYRVDIVSYIEERPTVEKREYVKYLKRCRCCSRHSHYKTDTKPDDPVPESKLVHPCHCNCRSYCRILSRKLAETLADIPVATVWDNPEESWDTWTPEPGTGWG